MKHPPAGYALIGLVIGAFISLVLDAALDSTLPPSVGWVMGLGMAALGWGVAKNIQSGDK
jgi:predicted lysophospholipase L1 biosynthesis ABC-type transport system permease subunit